jgi:hypothetical protein
VSGVGRVGSHPTGTLGGQAVVQGGISYNNINKCRNEFPGQHLLPTMT